MRIKTQYLENDEVMVFAQTLTGKILGMRVSKESFENNREDVIAEIQARLKARSSINRANRFKAKLGFYRYNPKALLKLMKK